MLDSFPFHSSLSSRQHTPGGALTFRKSSVVTPTQLHVVGLNSISTKGHIFAIEITTEPISYLNADKNAGKPGPYDMRIRLDYTERLMNHAVQAASSFYQKGATELPGFLVVSMGVLGAFDVRMMDENAWTSP
jgi:hypothetical protein